MQERKSHSKTRENLSPVLRFVVLPRASFTVTTGTSLDVERAVDLVLFSTIDRGKVFSTRHRHAGGLAETWKNKRINQ